MQTSGQSLDSLIDKEWLAEDGNIAAFMLYYFPAAFSGPNGPAWEPLNIQMCEALENEMEVMMWLPGGFGKSSTLLRWMVYVMCREPQIAIIFIEKTKPEATKRAHYLMQELESNKLLVAHYGAFKGDQWSTEGFTIRQRPELSQWPTVSFFGAGGHGGLGSRCNILLVDDPVTQDNSGSEVERANMWRWWSQAASTCPYPLPVKKEQYLKKTVVSGTTFHMDDLYHRVLKLGSLKHLHLRAVNDDGSTLAPNRFVYIPKEQLEQERDESEYGARLWNDIYKTGKVKNLHDFRRESGISAFMRRYQNIVSDPDEQIFPEVWFEGGDDEYAPPGGYPGCWDKGFALGEERKTGWKYVTGIDPAAGAASQNSARFASLTLAMDPENPRFTYLADLDFGQYPLVSDFPGKTTQAGVVLGQVQKYGSRISLETNNIQGVYDGVLRKEAQKRGLVLQITGHTTSRQRKTDESFGINAMAAMVENGLLRLPEKSRRKVQELVTEMTLYGVYPTDDLLMAFWFAWNLLERARNRPRITKADPEQVPAYMQQQASYQFPPHWTDEQKMRYLGIIPDDEEEAEAI
jgi:hypothetical protein